MDRPPSLAPLGRRWNYKAAILSSVLRASLFGAANISAGTDAALPYLAAMLRKRWHPRVRRPVLVGLTCERFDDNMAAYVSDSGLARAFTRWYIRRIYGPPFDAHIAVSDYAAAELRGALHDREPWFVRTCPMGVDAEGFAPSRRSDAVRDRLLRHTGGSARTTLPFYAAARRLKRTSVCWLRRCASSRVIIGPLEAMACGIPLVAPNAGGVLEYASPSNAWLAEPTGSAFADAIRAASLGDPDRIEAATDTVARFGWRDATRRYFDAYEDLHRRFSGPGEIGSCSSRAPAA